MRPEDLALEGGDVLLPDQLVIDLRDWILPQLRLQNPPAEVARTRTHSSAAVAPAFSTRHSTASIATSNRPTARRPTEPSRPSARARIASVAMRLVIGSSADAFFDATLHALFRRGARREHVPAVSLPKRSFDRLAFAQNEPIGNDQMRLREPTFAAPISRSSAAVRRVRVSGGCAESVESVEE